MIAAPPVACSVVSKQNRVSMPSFLYVSRARERIASEFADEAHSRAESRRSDSLIRTFAAGPEAEFGAHDGLAPVRELRSAKRQVGNEAPHDREPLLGHV